MRHPAIAIANRAHRLSTNRPEPCCQICKPSHAFENRTLVTCTPPKNADFAHQARSFFRYEASHRTPSPRRKAHRPAIDFPVLRGHNPTGYPQVVKLVNSVKHLDLNDLQLVPLPKTQTSPPMTRQRRNKRYAFNHFSIPRRTTPPSVPESHPSRNNHETTLPSFCCFHPRPFADRYPRLGPGSRRPRPSRRPPSAICPSQRLEERPTYSPRGLGPRPGRIRLALPPPPPPTLWLRVALRRRQLRPRPPQRRRHLLRRHRRPLGTSLHAKCPSRHRPEGHFHGRLIVAALLSRNCSSISGGTGRALNSSCVARCRASPSWPTGKHSTIVP